MINTNERRTEFRRNAMAVGLALTLMGTGIGILSVHNPEGASEISNGVRQTLSAEAVRGYAGRVYDSVRSGVDSLARFGKALLLFDEYE